MELTDTKNGEQEYQMRHAWDQLKGIETQTDERNTG